jgi:hypothetical protein
MERLLNVTTILSVLLMALVLFSVRRSHIRVEYSVSWLAAAVILLVLSRSSFALTWISRHLGLADPPLALLLLVFCVFVIVIYRLSVVISDLKDAHIAMAQRLAIVEFQLHNRQEESQVQEGQAGRADCDGSGAPHRSLDLDLRGQRDNRAARSV